MSTKLLPCRAVELHSEVVERSLPGVGLDLSPHQFVASEWERFRVNRPTLVHVKTDPENACVNLEYERIGRCLDVCDTQELRYPFPVGAGCFTFLPTGTYEVRIPSQPSFPLVAGESVTVYLQFEEVQADFVSYLTIMASSGARCC